MKRSEALNLVSSIIHEYRRSTEGVTSDELAEMVLAEMEKLGMRPPSFNDSREVIELPGRKLRLKYKSGWEAEDV